MELEFFVEKGSDEKWHDFWVKSRVIGGKTKVSAKAA